MPARERQGNRALYLSKYPEMAEFVDAPGTALVRIEVERYDVVDHFQHVLILDLGAPGAAHAEGEAP